MWSKSLNPAYTDNHGAKSDGKRFVFQNFAKRVATVSLDEVHRRTDLSDLREEGSTYAASTLERWVELNSTVQFKEFRTQLAPLVMTVPLILRRRQQIFEIVRAHLAVAPVIAIKPMLEVTAALAVDLRQEFYPEFPALLGCMAALLKPWDVELLEAVFGTICLLFQYLLRQLLADLPNAFLWYREMLSHPKPHVRDFAAESFAYLLRQAPLSTLPATLRSAVVPHAGSQGPALDSGIAHLFFHACRGQSARLHSRTPSFLGAIVAALPVAEGTAPIAALLGEGGEGNSPEVGEGGGVGVLVEGGEDDGLQRVLHEALALLSAHTRQQHAGPAWQPLAHAFGRALLRWRRGLVAQPAGGEAEAEEEGEEEETGHGMEEADEDEEEEAGGASAEARGVAAAVRLRRVSALLRQWTASRKGSRVPEGAAAAVLEQLQRQLTPEVLHAAAARGAVHLAAVHGLLRLLPPLLNCKSSPLAQAAVLRRSQALVPALLATPLAPGGAGGAGGDGHAQLGVLLLRGGLGLLDSGWHSFASVALPSVLEVCEVLAPSRPRAVRAALLRLAVLPSLRLPAEGRCAQLLCDSLAPAAAGGAAAPDRLATVWTAASILARLEAGSAGAMAPRLSTLLEAAIPHDNDEGDGGGGGGGGGGNGAALAAAAAAAIEARAALAAGGRQAPLELAEHALRMLHRHLPPAPQLTAYGAAPAAIAASAPVPPALLLRSCALAVRGVHAAGLPPPPRSPAVAPLLPSLLPCLSVASAAVRGGALELLEALHALRWLGGEPNAAAPAAAGAGSAAKKLKAKGGSSAAAGASSSPPPTSAADAALAKLLQLAQRVEASPEAPNSKQLVLDFEALAALHRGNQLDALGVEALAHFALGSLRIRFARVWPLARQLLLELARSP